jgi:hypothetical protein
MFCYLSKCIGNLLAEEQKAEPGPLFYRQSLLGWPLDRPVGWHLSLRTLSEAAWL